jgi:hypothetical protein
LLSLVSFTKVFSRKTEKKLNYTTSENVLEELRILEKQKGWAIFENLKVLINGKADSFSFTKDNPYHYFYARITEENVIFKMKTSEDEIEFRVPLQQFSLI